MSVNVLLSPEALQLMLLAVKAGRMAESQVRLAGMIDVSDAEIDRLLADRDAVNAAWARLAPNDGA